MSYESVGKDLGNILESRGVKKFAKRLRGVIKTIAACEECCGMCDLSMYGNNQKAMIQVRLYTDSHLAMWNMVERLSELIHGVVDATDLVEFNAESTGRDVMVYFVTYVKSESCDMLCVGGDGGVGE